MAVIGVMIVESVLLAVFLTALSIMFKDKSISRDDEGLQRFLIFAYAYLTGIASYFAIYLLNNSPGVLKYILILIIWYSYCAILASMIIQSMYIFGNDNLIIKRAAEVLCYYALFSVLIELLFLRFSFDYNTTGLEFSPGVVPKSVYYATPIIVYYVCMGYLLWDYHKLHTKEREKHLMKIALLAIIPSFIGLIAETVCHTVFHVRYPVFFVMFIISFKAMSDLHIKNRSFMLKESDFDTILKADNTDAVFICDDEQTIIYQNRAARINAQLYRDSFIGRKLTDAFVIDADVRRAMRSKDARDGLMVPAIYPLTERKIVMSVEYIYDCVDEILCSIITIPNYDISVDENSFALQKEDETEDPSVLTAKVPSVVETDDDMAYAKEISAIDSNINILIVDENEDDLNKFEELLNVYDIKVSRARGGRAAIEMLLDPCYDAVFIAYDMPRLNGVETAKRIRSMGKEYYGDLPLIFILNESVANVYKDLLDVSFNDFLEKPLTVKKLDSIMTRWLWRRYAVTEGGAGTGFGSTRAVRSVNALQDMYSDCLTFIENDKINYIGYTLKGMKRLCVKLEDKALLDACDNMTDIYIRGQYAQIPAMLQVFNEELKRVRSSATFGMTF